MNVSELFQRSYFKWSFELDNLSLIYCAESSVFNLHLQIIMKTFATALILATAEAGNYNIPLRHHFLRPPWFILICLIFKPAHKSAAVEAGAVAENQAPLHRCCTDYFNTADNESCITWCFSGFFWCCSCCCCCGNCCICCCLYFYCWNNFQSKKKHQSHRHGNISISCCWSRSCSLCCCFILLLLEQQQK